MEKIRRRKNKGMSLTEILISITLTSMIIGIAMSMWFFAYRNWATERISTKIRIDLQVAMKRIKEEIRLSSLTYTNYYPVDALEHTAISFPLAKADPENSNFFDLNNSTGQIIWDKSVIYHKKGTELLRREVSFLSTESARDTQLAAVATGNKTTDDKIVCKNVSDFTIAPTFQLFDGYSATPKRSVRVEFGLIELDYGADGYHDFKFEVVGTSGGGYKFGIDTLSVTPSGCEREIEAYYPLSSPHSHSGGSPSKKDDVTGCSGHYYLEYSSGAVEDYVNLRLFHDVYQESNFQGTTTQQNILITGDDSIIRLRIPKEVDLPCWSAASEASGTWETDTINVVSSEVEGVTIRNVLSHDNIEIDHIDGVGTLVRVKFSDPTYALSINKAYIAEQKSGTAYDVEPDTARQLFFSDDPLSIGTPEPEDYGLKIGNDGGLALPGVDIPADGYYVWSNWIVFDMKDKDYADGPDYLVSLYLITGTGPTTKDLSAWKGVEINSFYTEGNKASTDSWSALPKTETNNIYCLESTEAWPNSGTAISPTYDTQLAAPDYRAISWDPGTAPAGSSITVSARSSDNVNMTDATAWKTVTVNGGSLGAAIDGGRYLEFRANLTKTSNYADYNNYPWIDNVLINWPGESPGYKVSVYFTQKPDYGIIKLTVDGKDFTKGLEFEISVSETSADKTYENSLQTEVEPRNTGR